MPENSSFFCSALDVNPQYLHSGRGFKARAALLSQAFWGRGARLTIGFLEGEAALHARVAELAERWITETSADIQFEFWIASRRDPREANLRVAFRPEKGSQSVLGRYAVQVTGGAATMNLGWMTLDLADDKASAVVLHEFGHALGLIHEHLNPAQRIDWNVRNVTDDLRRTQGWSDDIIQANMFAHYDQNEVFATDIDSHSIMMYPIPETWTNNGFSAPFNSSLTAQDKALIKAAYGLRPVFGAR